MWRVWWWPRMLLIFFRKWQRVWNFKRASVKNPLGGISGQHQQKWIKKCEEKRLLNFFCLLTARGCRSEYYHLWRSPVRAMWRYLLQKGLAYWSLLAQCSFVGLVIPFLLSYHYFILINVGYPLDNLLLKHVAQQVPSLAPWLSVSTFIGILQHRGNKKSILWLVNYPFTIAHVACAHSRCR